MLQPSRNYSIDNSEDPCCHLLSTDAAQASALAKCSLPNLPAGQLLTGLPAALLSLSQVPRFLLLMSVPVKDSSESLSVRPGYLSCKDTQDSTISLLETSANLPVHCCISPKQHLDTQTSWLGTRCTVLGWIIPRNCCHCSCAIL